MGAGFAFLLGFLRGVLEKTAVSWWSFAGAIVVVWCHKRGA
jgi:hypothetical protein